MTPLESGLKNALLILSRVSLVLLSLFAGKFLSDNLVLIPDQIINLPDVTLTFDDFVTIGVHFGVIHLVLFAISQATFKSGVFKALRRTTIEIYVLVLGFTLASLSLFFTTSINFSPELLFGSALSAFLFFVICYVVLPKAEESQREGWSGNLVALLTDTLLLPVKRPVAILIILFAMSPILVAFLFVSSRDFANTVTSIRIALNSRGSYDWTLVNPFPGASFRQPMMVEFSPSNPNEAYVLERHGRLQRIYLDEEQPQKELILDFSDRVGYVEIELGALGFDLHPLFGSSDREEKGYIYVYYTDYILGDRQQNRLSRFDISLPTPQDRYNSETILFELNRDDSGFHNGGSVEFGPDNFLYIALGEATDPAGHQRVDRSLFGGIIRIDVDRIGGDVSHPPLRQPANGRSALYYIPNDNPFVGLPNAMEEFYAIGLRNPFRISFDSNNGNIWAGEVGSTKWEEVNLIRAGGNYEYPFIEGKEYTNIPLPNEIIGERVEPVYHYVHTAYERSVIGGSVYRGNQRPDLSGKYIFADNYSGHIYAMPSTGAMVDEPETLAKADQIAQRGITSMVNATNGELFVTTLGASQIATGKVLMLVRTDDADQYESADFMRDQDELTLSDASGQELYMTNCSRCHGVVGKGDGPDAPILLELDGVEMPDLTSAEVQNGRTDEEWKQIIAIGGEPFGLDYNMAPWEGILTEAEIDNVVEHLRTFQ